MPAISLDILGDPAVRALLQDCVDLLDSALHAAEVGATPGDGWRARATKQIEWLTGQKHMPHQRPTIRPPSTREGEEEK